MTAKEHASADVAAVERLRDADGPDEVISTRIELAVGLHCSGAGSQILGGWVPTGG
jgi:hypothetical protein